MDKKQELERDLAVAKNDIEHLKKNDDRLEKSVEHISKKTDEIADEMRDVDAKVTGLQIHVDLLSQKVDDQHAEMKAEIHANTQAISKQVSDESKASQDLTKKNGTKFSWMVGMLVALELLGSRISAEKALGAILSALG